MSTPAHAELDNASRSDLIARAEALGVEKADVLTRVELIDEIVKRTIADPLERRLARGFLGVARDLVARVVERGLHLPDAAALIRGLQQVTLNPGTPPIATVTLAEIYAKQGHRDRAAAVLDEVLRIEPEHLAARVLRERVAALQDDEIATIAPPEGVETAESPQSAEVELEPSFDRNDGEVAEDGIASVGEGAEGLLAFDGANDGGGVAPSDVGELEQAFSAGGTDPAPTEPELDDRETQDRDTDDRDTDDPFVTQQRLRDPIARFESELERALQPEPPDHDSEAPRATLRPVPARASEGSIPPVRDALVLVPVDETRILARWELRNESLEGARRRAPRGTLILRIVAVTPSWDGPCAEVRDVELEHPAGDWWVNGLPSSAVLRAAVGWRAESGFDPLAVALDVLSPIDSASAPESGPVSYPSPDGSASGIEERALRRADQGRREHVPTSSSWRTLALAPWEAPPALTPIENFETR
jgi:hypothetical protein